jgi:hypothetical protein
MDDPEYKRKSLIVDVPKLIEEFKPDENEIDRRILFEITGMQLKGEPFTSDSEHSDDETN